MRKGPPGIIILIINGTNRAIKAIILVRPVFKIIMTSNIANKYRISHLSNLTSHRIIIIIVSNREIPKTSLIKTTTTT